MSLEQAQYPKTVKLILCGKDVEISCFLPNTIDEAIKFKIKVPTYSGYGDKVTTIKEEREFKVWMSVSHIMFHVAGQSGFTSISIKDANSMLGNLTGIIKLEIS